MATPVIGAGEIALTWNGTVCDEDVTIGSVTAARRVISFEMPQSVGNPMGEPIPLRGGSSRDGAPVVEGAPGVIWLQSTCTGIATLERGMLDEWSLLGVRYNPFGGLVTLSCTRKDQGGSDVTRVLKVEALEAPAAFYATGAGLTEPGMRPAGWLRYPVRFFSYAPFWQAGSNTGSQVYAVSGSTDSHTLANPGFKPCGGKITISNVSGNISKFSITNSTTGQVLTIQTSAASFTNGDYVDFYYTNINDDPFVSGAGTITLGAGLGEFELALGNNTVVSQRVTGTGTCDATIVWKALYASF